MHTHACMHFTQLAVKWRDPAHDSSRMWEFLQTPNWSSAIQHSFCLNYSIISNIVNFLNCKSHHLIQMYLTTFNGLLLLLGWKPIILSGLTMPCLILQPLLPLCTITLIIFISLKGSGYLLLLDQPCLCLHLFHPCSHQANSYRNIRA